MCKTSRLGTLIVCVWAVSIASGTARAQQGPADATADQASADQTSAMAALQAELDRIRGILPAQAVAMTVVEYNFTNLWFAAHAGNWPQAMFFLSETRARLRWALRIAPERRISTGTIALQPYLDAFDESAYASLERALQSEDIPAFEAAYESGLGACQSCHAASEKAFLRFTTPSAPASHLIEFATD